MAKSKKAIIDLKKMNLSFEERNNQIKLLSFKTSTMTIDVEIYEKGQLLKKDTIVFAHLPKKLKAKLNPLF
ncbi:hypothetical protein [Thalassospira alkalitolerans]|uniref:hypothetical protein n=1 Tax=Thalassospira alkalitolerans TaxID=1293890 RepID=UPI003AA91DCD|tara:strand:+ start:428 stop:640 length:213 start_codon:yes stop_codon:yes gene_type:complete